MGYVYVLSNPSMDGLVKIGSTDRSVEERAAELSATTGVPTRFEIELFAFFRDHTAAEYALHNQLSGYRVRDGREFFRLSAEQACNSLRELQLANLILEITELDDSSRSTFFDALAEGYPSYPIFAKYRSEISMVSAESLSAMSDEQLSAILEEVIRRRPAVWRQLR